MTMRSVLTLCFLLTTFAAAADPSPEVARLEYLFSVAAGILPAVEPGILPGGMGVWFGKPLPIRTSGPGGKMPPSTVAKMAAATDVHPTLNTYAVRAAIPAFLESALKIFVCVRWLVFFFFAHAVCVWA